MTMQNGRPQSGGAYEVKDGVVTQVEAPTQTADTKDAVETLRDPFEATVTAPAPETAAPAAQKKVK